MEFMKAYQHNDRTDFTTIYSQSLQGKKRSCTTIFTGFFLGMWVSIIENVWSV